MKPDIRDLFDEQHIDGQTILNRNPEFLIGLDAKSDLQLEPLSFQISADQGEDGQRVIQRLRHDCDISPDDTFKAIFIEREFYLDGDGTMSIVERIYKIPFQSHPNTPSRAILSLHLARYTDGNISILHITPVVPNAHLKRKFSIKNIAPTVLTSARYPITLITDSLPDLREE